MKSTRSPILSWRPWTSTKELARGSLLRGHQQEMQGSNAHISHMRPRPGRRRHYDYQLSSNPILTFIFTVLLFSLLCAPTVATYQQEAQTRKPRVKLVERIEEILFDSKAVLEPILHRRQGDSTVEASTIAAPTSTKGASTETTSTSSPPSTSILSAPTQTNSPLPKPFDGGIGTNFTQPSCPTFLNAMISNDTFTSCLPFSLLLQNSVSFFSATHTLSSITAVLNASCNIVFPECSAIISAYANQLRSSSACGQDYDRQNPIIRQAYAGLIAYDILYHASCLKNTPSTGPGQNNENYCFANAITNESDPTDSYIYYLPLGIPLPAGSLPTCDACLKETMALFAQEASNKSQPLNLDYVAAAELVNQDCGPGFVNGSIVSASGGGGSSTSSAIARLGPRFMGVGVWSVVLAVLGIAWL